jgi:hypothetical protein
MPKRRLRHPRPYAITDADRTVRSERARLFYENLTPEEKAKRVERMLKGRGIDRKLPVV